MFKAIGNAMAICLQGTILERKPRHGKQPAREAQCVYSLDKRAVPPYVLTHEEYKIKGDIITKHHTTDNGLQQKRKENRAARAHWCRDNYEQTYIPPAPPAVNNPQVEIYYRILGLHMVRDTRVSFTGMVR